MNKANNYTDSILLILDLFQPPFCPSQVPAQVHHLRPLLLRPVLKVTVLLIKTGRPADESLPRKTSICWIGSGNIPWMTCPLQVSCLYHQCVLDVINFWWKGVGDGEVLTLMHFIRKKFVSSLVRVWERFVSDTRFCIQSDHIFTRVIDSMVENKVKW